MLRVGIRGTCNNGTGSSKALDVKLEVSDGDSTIFVAAEGMSVIAGTREVFIDGEYLIISTAEQKGSIIMKQASWEGGPTDENLLFNALWQPLGAVGIDTSRPISVGVFIKPSVASLSLTFNKLWGYIELI